MKSEEDHGTTERCQQDSEDRGGCVHTWIRTLRSALRCSDSMLVGVGEFTGTTWWDESSYVEPAVTWRR